MKSHVNSCTVVTVLVFLLFISCLAQAADLEPLTWNPGTSGFDWKSPGNWDGSSGLFPDDSFDQAIFNTKGTTADPILDGNLEGSDGGLGQLVFNAAGWTVWNESGEDNVMNFNSIEYYGYNAIFSSGSGVNTIKPKVAFLNPGLNVYTGSGNTLVFEQVSGSYAFNVSSTNPTSADTGAVKLTGNNSTLSNAFLIRQGTLLVANNGALGSGSSTIYFGDSYSANGANARLLTDGAYTISKNLEVRNISGHAVNATIGGNQATGNSTFSGTLTLGRTASLQSNGGTVSFTNTISGAGGVTKTGGGTVVLSHANSYQGATNVSTGTLRTGAIGALPSTTDVTVQTTLDLAGYNQTINSLSGGGSVALGSAQLTVGSGTFAGPISGTSGSLSKTGAGTLTLTGTNSYTGATSVAQGILLVNGQHNNGGTYTVSSGATLGGSGSIYAPVNIQNGGYFSPGQSIGQMNVYNNVDLDGTLKIEADAMMKQIDLLAVSGLDITNATVDFDIAGILYQEAYVFGAYNLLTGSCFANVIDLPEGYMIDYDYNGGKALALVVVPEPATICLLGLGALGLLRRKRGV